MVNARLSAIVELIQIEQNYQELLELYDEAFRPGLSPFLNEAQISLFFSDLNTLTQISVRFYVLLKEEQKNGAEYAQIGKIFTEQSEDIAALSQTIDLYLERTITFYGIYHANKKLKQKVKGIERRGNQRFRDILGISVSHLIGWSESLSKILKVTPEWHIDHSFLNTSLEELRGLSVRASVALNEGRRRLALMDEERKIRKCPPLVDEQRKFIGVWALTQDTIFVHLFNDMILIVQQRVEILSRKKYFVIQREIKLENVVEIVKEKAGLKLKLRGSSDIVLLINLKADELIDAVKANLIGR
jgi:hypothetical protein